MHAGTASFDRLLSHLHARDAAGLGETLAPDAVVTLVDEAGERRARDAAGRAALLAEICSDPALAGRQVRGDVHAVAPAFTAVLTYELPGPTRARRVVWARLERERARELVVHRA
jgi:hypothetical protein